MPLHQQIPLAITSGEPAGIGIDVCLGILNTKFDHPIEILVDIESLKERARQLNQLDQVQTHLNQDNRHITFKDISVNAKVVAGKLNVYNAPYVLALLDQAIVGVEHGVYAGIVTGPIHKGIINESGIVFTGHTEYFKKKSGVHRVVMMLSNNKLKVALATTHLPLREVADAITFESIIGVVRMIHQEFKTKFKIDQPKIAIMGLNPHAGESGYLGTEEIEVLIPAIEQLQQEDIAVSGPYPADTMFQIDISDKHDVILAMYHDQGLPVVKYASFGNTVNITLGLPYVRTSVDHGTALGLAGSGKADASSLIQAIKIASQMI